MNNNINRLIKVIYNSKKFIVLILIIFIAIGCTYSFSYKTPMYKSTATFVLVQNLNNSESISQKDLTINQNLISTYSKIAKSNKILKQVIENLNLEISEEELAKEISIEAVKNTEVLRITVLNENSQIAADTANELYNVFSEEVSKLYNISNIHVVDLAEKAEEAYNINHIKDIMIFVSLGVVISSILVGIIYIMDTTIKSEKDVETYTDLSVLSTIPLTDVKNSDELITKNEPKSIIAESFKTLRTNIMYSIQNRKLKTILVTSGYMGEGKSFVSSNLAITFAQSGKRVIFIDTDMRKGRIKKVFNIENKKGLSNCLADINTSKKKVNINNYINETETPNLHIMTSGDVPPNPSELLGSENMQKLLYTLNTQYDIIICDSAPCMLVTDSVVLSKIVDTTIIVTSNKTTKINNLIETEKSIKLVGGNISGVIINKINENKKEYKNKYYYGHPEQLLEENNNEKEIKLIDKNKLKNKLYLKEIEIIKEKEIKPKELKENSKKIIIKNNKDNSNEIKELKSLYKILMKNTLNILLNKEEKAESILDKIDDIKITYRNDLEIIKGNQERYEQELAKLEDAQKENKKEISLMKRNQKNIKNEIKSAKSNYKKDKKEIIKNQNNNTEQIEKIKDIEKENINEIENNLNKIKEEYQNNNYEEKIMKLQEEFLKMQENNRTQMEKLINTIEKLQVENTKRDKEIENKKAIKLQNKYDNNKTEEKIIEMQKYINTIEENSQNNSNEIKNNMEYAENIIPENTIIIKELKIQKLSNNKSDNKKENKYAIDYEKIKNKNKNVFAFFGKKNNNKINDSVEIIEDNNEIISQILLETK